MIALGFRGEMDITPPSEGGVAGSIPAGTTIKASSRTPVRNRERINARRRVGRENGTSLVIPRPKAVGVL